MRVLVPAPFVLLWLAACAGAQPAAAPVAPPASPRAPVAAAPAEPTPELSALPAPDGLSFTLHVAHPKAMADLLASMLGSTPWLALIGGKLDVGELVAIAAGAPIGPLLDLDQPMDFAVSDVDTDGVSPRIAGSAVLSNPVEAREALAHYFTLEPTAPGVVRLYPREDAPEGSRPSPCMMALAAGSTTRLVCGMDKPSLLHLGPYLTRTMPRVASGSDLRLEVFMHGLHMPHQDDAEDSATAAPDDVLIKGVFDTMTTDIGSLVVEASSDAATADLRVVTVFPTAASPATRAFVGLGAPDPHPPAAYARLPANASFTWFSRGATPADLAPLKSVFMRALALNLAGDGYTPAQIKDQMAPVDAMALTGGPWVVAGGYRLDAARAALDAYVAGPKTLAARAKARSALQGWIVAEVDEPPKAWLDAVRAMVKLDAQKPSGKAQAASPGAGKSGRKPPREHSTFALAPVAAALMLPDGTLHVEVHTAPSAKWLAAQPKGATTPPSIAHTGHLLLVPDGSRTWMAYAEDLALAASEVRACLDPASASRVPGKGPLEVMPRSGGGSVSAAAIAMLGAGDSTDEELRKTRDALTSLSTLQGAADPVPFAVVATPGAGGAASGGDVAFRVLVPIGLAIRAATATPPIF